MASILPYKFKPDLVPENVNGPEEPLQEPVQDISEWYVYLFIYLIVFSSM